MENTKNNEKMSKLREVIDNFEQKKLNKQNNKIIQLPIKPKVVVNNNSDKRMDEIIRTLLAIASVNEDRHKELNYMRQSMENIEKSMIEIKQNIKQKKLDNAKSPIAKLFNKK